MNLVDLKKEIEHAKSLIGKKISYNNFTYIVDDWDITFTLYNSFVVNNEVKNSGYCVQLLCQNKYNVPAKFSYEYVDEVVFYFPGNYKYIADFDEKVWKCSMSHGTDIPFKLLDDLHKMMILSQDFRSVQFKRFCITRTFLKRLVENQNKKNYENN